jgi:hypothetical protein
MAEGAYRNGNVESELVTSFPLDVEVPMLAVETAVTTPSSTRGRTLSDPPLTVMSAGRAPQRP